MEALEILGNLGSSVQQGTGLFVGTITPFYGKCSTNRQAASS
ncbi:hypothetical protein C5167_035875 [Papaver somniferum]|nr:hypothetical protein C5167_035875 [Papaver somniferum]